MVFVTVQIESITLSNTKGEQMDVEELAAEIFTQVAVARFTGENPDSRDPRYAPDLARACFDWAAAFVAEGESRGGPQVPDLAEKLREARARPASVRTSSQSAKMDFDPRHLAQQRGKCA